MGAHTPGPWHTDGDAVWAEAAAPGICVTVIPPEGVHFVARPEAERHANALLIAQAPALLALAKQYAAECATCGGTGCAVSMALNEPHGRDCPDCAEIRAVIDAVEGTP